MGKELKRFLWGLLSIVLLFLSIQNFKAVEAGLGMLLDWILPLIYGCVIAFVVNLVVKWLETFPLLGGMKNSVVRRIISVTLSFLILVGAVAALVAGLIPEIRESVTMLAEQMPGYIQHVIDFCVLRLGLPESWFSDLKNLDIGALAGQMFQSGILQQVLQSGGSFVGGAVSSLLDFLLGLCFSIYLLMQKENLISGVKRLVRAYLTPRNSEGLIRIGTAMNEIYSSFISGQCLDALILGAMVTVSLLIFRINYALLIGIVIAVTALVPVVGAFLGGAVGVFLLLMISLREAIVFLVIFLVLQQIDNRLVYPHVVGNAVGLPAVWIFAAIVVGGNFGGIFGMILAIPLFALVYTLVSEDLHKREELQEKR